MLVLAAGAGAVAAWQPSIAAFLTAVVLVSAWVRLCARRPVAAVGVLVAVVVFSSHALALAYSMGVPASAVRAMIGGKDLLAWSLVIVLAGRALRERRSSWAVPLWIGAFLVSTAAIFVLMPSPAPMGAQLSAIRGAAIPVLALACVALLGQGERRRAGIVTAYVVAVGATYALLELALPRTFLTNTINVGAYWSEVKEQSLFIEPVTNLPGNFFTTSGFPRLTGTFGDPLAAGAVLGAGLILVVAYRPLLRYRNLLLIVVSAALLLTFTRNGWLLAAVGLAALAVRRHGFGRALGWGIGAAIAVLTATWAFPPLNAYLTGVLSGEDASTLAHEAALQQAFQTAIPVIGEGWGTGGAVALNSFAGAVTTENAYAAVLTQIGWVGAVLLGVPLLALGYLTVRGQPLAAVGGAVLLLEAATGIVSENVLTFNAGFLPFVAAGLVAAVGPSVARGPVDAGQVHLRSRTGHENDRAVNVDPNLPGRAVAVD